MHEAGGMGFLFNIACSQYQCFRYLYIIFITSPFIQIFFIKLYVYVDELIIVHSVAFQYIVLSIVSCI